MADVSHSKLLVAGIITLILALFLSNALISTYPPTTGLVGGKATAAPVCPAMFDFVCPAYSTHTNIGDVSNLFGNSWQDASAQAKASCDAALEYCREQQNGEYEDNQFRCTRAQCIFGQRSQSTETPCAVQSCGEYTLGPQSITMCTYSGSQLNVNAQGIVTSVSGNPNCQSFPTPGIPDDAVGSSFKLCYYTGQADTTPYSCNLYTIPY